ncbi:MAG: hypothetical protein NC924_02715 [Candidatus Omnitrophica bacterium]|nr:hypothetical protein [Candidatus Omnitrophota bacterium]
MLDAGRRRVVQSVGVDRRQIIQEYTQSTRLQELINKIPLSLGQPPADLPFWKQDTFKKINGAQSEVSPPLPGAARDDAAALKAALAAAPAGAAGKTGALGAAAVHAVTGMQVFAAAAGAQAGAAGIIAKAHAADMPAQTHAAEPAQRAAGVVSEEKIRAVLNELTADFAERKKAGLPCLVPVVFGTYRDRTLDTAAIVRTVEQLEFVVPQLLRAGMVPEAEAVLDFYFEQTAAGRRPPANAYNRFNGVPQSFDAVNAAGVITKPASESLIALANAALSIAEATGKEKWFEFAENIFDRMLEYNPRVADALRQRQPSFVQMIADLPRGVWAWIQSWVVEQNGLWGYSHRITPQMLENIWDDLPLREFGDEAFIRQLFSAGILIRSADERMGRFSPAMASAKILEISLDGIEGMTPEQRRQALALWHAGGFTELPPNERIEPFLQIKNLPVNPDYFPAEVNCKTMLLAQRINDLAQRLARAAGALQVPDSLARKASFIAERQQGWLRHNIFPDLQAQDRDAGLVNSALIDVYNLQGIKVQGSTIEKVLAQNRWATAPASLLVFETAYRLGEIDQAQLQYLLERMAGHFQRKIGKEDDMLFGFDTTVLPIHAEAVFPALMARFRRVAALSGSAEMVAAADAALQAYPHTPEDLWPTVYSAVPPSQAQSSRGIGLDTGLRRHGRAERVLPPADSRRASWPADLAASIEGQFSRQGYFPYADDEAAVGAAQAAVSRPADEARAPAARRGVDSQDTVAYGELYGPFFPVLLATLAIVFLPWLLLYFWRAVFAPYRRHARLMSAGEYAGDRVYSDTIIRTMYARNRQRVLATVEGGAYPGGSKAALDRRIFDSLLRRSDAHIEGEFMHYRMVLQSMMLAWVRQKMAEEGAPVSEDDPRLLMSSENAPENLQEALRWLDECDEFCMFLSTFFRQEVAAGKDIQMQGKLEARLQNAVARLKPLMQNRMQAAAARAKRDTQDPQAQQDQDTIAKYDRLIEQFWQDILGIGFPLEQRLAAMVSDNLHVQNIPAREAVRVNIHNPALVAEAAGRAVDENQAATSLVAALFAELWARRRAHYITQALRAPQTVRVDVAAVILRHLDKPVALQEALKEFFGAELPAFDENTLQAAMDASKAQPWDLNALSAELVKAVFVALDIAAAHRPAVESAVRTWVAAYAQTIIQGNTDQTSLEQLALELSPYCSRKLTAAAIARPILEQLWQAIAAGSVSALVAPNQARRLRLTYPYQRYAHLGRVSGARLQAEAAAAAQAAKPEQEGFQQLKDTLESIAANPQALIDALRTAGVLNADNIVQRYIEKSDSPLLEQLPGTYAAAKPFIVEFLSRIRNFPAQRRREFEGSFLDSLEAFVRDERINSIAPLNVEMGSYLDRLILLPFAYLAARMTFLSNLSWAAVFKQLATSYLAAFGSWWWLGGIVVLVLAAIAVEWVAHHRHGRPSERTTWIGGAVLAFAAFAGMMMEASFFEVAFLKWILLVVLTLEGLSLSWPRVLQYVYAYGKDSLPFIAPLIGLAIGGWVGWTALFVVGVLSMRLIYRFVIHRDQNRAALTGVRAYGRVSAGKDILFELTAADVQRAAAQSAVAISSPEKVREVVLSVADTHRFAKKSLREMYPEIVHNLLEQGTVAKSKIDEIDSTGMIWDQLIEHGVLSEPSATAARLQPHLDQKEQIVMKIAGSDGRIFEILQKCQQKVVADEANAWTLVEQLVPAIQARSKQVFRETFFPTVSAIDPQKRSPHSLLGIMLYDKWKAAIAKPRLRDIAVYIAYYGLIVLFAGFVGKDPNISGWFTDRFSSPHFFDAFKVFAGVYSLYTLIFYQAPYSAYLIINSAQSIVRSLYRRFVARVWYKSRLVRGLWGLITQGNWGAYANLSVASVRYESVRQAKRVLSNIVLLDEITPALQSAGAGGITQEQVNTALAAVLRKRIDVSNSAQRAAILAELCDLLNVPDAQPARKDAEKIFSELLDGTKNLEEATSALNDYFNKTTFNPFTEARLTARALKKAGFDGAAVFAGLQQDGFLDAHGRVLPAFYKKAGEWFIEVQSNPQNLDASKVWGQDTVIVKLAPEDRQRLIDLLNRVISPQISADDLREAMIKGMVKALDLEADTPRIAADLLLKKIGPDPVKQDDARNFLRASIRHGEQAGDIVAGLKSMGIDVTEDLLAEQYRVVLNQAATQAEAARAQQAEIVEGFLQEMGIKNPEKEMTALLSGKLENLGRERKIAVFTFGGVSRISAALTDGREKATRNVLEHYDVRLKQASPEMEHFLRARGLWTADPAETRRRVQQCIDALHNAEIENNTTLVHLIQLQSELLPAHLRLRVDDLEKRKRAVLGYELRLYFTEMTGAVGDLDNTANFIDRAQKIRQVGMGRYLQFIISNNKYSAAPTGNDPLRVLDSPADGVQLAERYQQADLIRWLAGDAQVHNDWTHYGMKSGGMDSIYMSECVADTRWFFIEDRNATTMDMARYIEDTVGIVNNRNISIYVANRDTTDKYNPVGESSFLVEMGFCSTGPAQVSTGWANQKTETGFQSLRMHSYAEAPVMPLTKATYRQQRAQGGSFMRRFYNSQFGLIGFNANAPHQSEDYAALLETVHTMIAMGLDPDFAMTQAYWTKKRETYDMGPWQIAPVRWSAGRLQTINDFLLQLAMEFSGQTVYSREAVRNQGRFYIIMPVALLTVLLLPFMIILDLTPFSGINAIYYVIGLVANQILTLHGALALMRVKGYAPLSGFFGAAVLGMFAWSSWGLLSATLLFSILGCFLGGFAVAWSQWLAKRPRDGLLFAPRIIIEHGGQLKGHKGITFEFHLSENAPDSHATPNVFLSILYYPKFKQFQILGSFNDKKMEHWFDISGLTFSWQVGLVGMIAAAVAVLKLDLLNVFMFKLSLIFAFGMLAGANLMKKKIGQDTRWGGLARIGGFLAAAVMYIAVSYGMIFISGGVVAIGVPHAVIMAGGLLLALLVNIYPVRRILYNWGYYRHIDLPNMSLGLLKRHADLHENQVVAERIVAGFTRTLPNMLRDRLAAELSPALVAYAKAGVNGDRDALIDRVVDVLDAFFQTGNIPFDRADENVVKILKEQISTGLSSRLGWERRKSFTSEEYEALMKAKIISDDQDNPGYVRWQVDDLTLVAMETKLKTLSLSKSQQDAVLALWFRQTRAPEQLADYVLRVRKIGVTAEQAGAVRRVAENHVKDFYLLGGLENVFSAEELVALVAKGLLSAYKDGNGKVIEYQKRPIYYWSGLTLSDDEVQEKITEATAGKSEFREKVNKAIAAQGQRWDSIVSDFSAVWNEFGVALDNEILRAVIFKTSGHLRTSLNVEDIAAESKKHLLANLNKKFRLTHAQQGALFKEIGGEAAMISVLFDATQAAALAQTIRDFLGTAAEQTSIEPLIHEALRDAQFTQSAKVLNERLKEEGPEVLSAERSSGFFGAIKDLFSHPEFLFVNRWARATHEAARGFWSGIGMLFFIALVPKSPMLAGTFGAHKFAFNLGDAEQFILTTILAIAGYVYYGKLVVFFQLQWWKYRAEQMQTALRQEIDQAVMAEKYPYTLTELEARLLEVERAIANRDFRIIKIAVEDADELWKNYDSRIIHQEDRLLNPIYTEAPRPKITEFFAYLGKDLSSVFPSRQAVAYATGILLLVGAVVTVPLLVFAFSGASVMLWSGLAVPLVLALMAAWMFSLSRRQPVPSVEDSAGAQDGGLEQTLLAKDVTAAEETAQRVSVEEIDRTLRAAQQYNEVALDERTRELVFDDLSVMSEELPQLWQFLKTALTDPGLMEFVEGIDERRELNAEIRRIVPLVRRIARGEASPGVLSVESDSLLLSDGYRPFLRILSILAPREFSGGFALSAAQNQDLCELLESDLSADAEHAPAEHIAQIAERLYGSEPAGEFLDAIEVSTVKDVLTAYLGNVYAAQGIYALANLKGSDGAPVLAAAEIVQILLLCATVSSAVSAAPKDQPGVLLRQVVMNFTEVNEENALMLRNIAVRAGTERIVAVLSDPVRSAALFAGEPVVIEAGISLRMTLNDQVAEVTLGVNALPQTQTEPEYVAAQQPETPASAEAQPPEISSTAVAPEPRAMATTTDTFDMPVRATSRRFDFVEQAI